MFCRAMKESLKWKYVIHPSFIFCQIIDATSIFSFMLCYNLSLSLFSFRSALLKLLHECVATGSHSPKFLQLVMKVSLEINTGVYWN